VPPLLQLSPLPQVALICEPVQAPEPLQVAAVVRDAPTQEMVALQAVLLPQSSQEPPEHLPSVRQVAWPVVGQAASAVPSTTGPQVPSVPDALSAAEQAWQAPLHCVVQHTPSVQNPLVQSPPAAHMAPVPSFPMHTLPLQKLPAAHWALVVHAPKHEVVPLQT
jgi:hypothetical protein